MQEDLIIYLLVIRPLMLQAGTTYTVDVTSFGAGTQSFMTGWGYSNAIPEPGTLGVLALAGFGFTGLRRRSV